MHSQNDRTVPGSQTGTLVGFTPKVYYLGEGKTPIEGNSFHWTGGWRILRKPRVRYQWDRSDSAYAGWREIPSPTDFTGTIFIDCENSQKKTLEKQCRIFGFLKEDNHECLKAATPVISRFVMALNELHTKCMQDPGVRLEFGQATKNSARKGYGNAPSVWCSAVREQPQGKSAMTTPEPSELHALLMKMGNVSE